MREKLKPVAPALSKLLLSLLSVFFFSASAFSQAVTGIVSDANNQPLTGVTVQVKNTTKATVTNEAGRFQIAAAGNDVLVFSYVGYGTEEVTLNGRTNLSISLSTGAQNLSEVVVTALGIKKESRRLGYAATTVNTEQLSINRTNNVGNGLEGKVAGVNVSPPASGPGGSSKIRIRGQSSFGANNSPLIIVNGVPINNSSISGANSNANGTGNPTGGSSDQGDGLQSINPDDIESMTVLKGAPAAALYGSRAKDGAIIITTKTGRGNKGIGVEITSNVQMEEALDYTDFQYEYGEGENGKRPANLADAQSMSVHSFGTKLDGSPQIIFDGSTQPYLAHKDRIKKFYRTGNNVTTGVALSGANENGSFRLGFSSTNATAIVPNSDYHKKIANLGLSYNLTPKFSVQLNANYSNEYNHNPPQIGIQDMNTNTTIYTLATSLDVDWLNNYKDVNGNEMPLSRFTNRNNPYWIAYERFENVHRDRIFGNASLRYQLTKWLYAQGRFGQDYYTRPYDYNRPTGTRSIPSASIGFNGVYYQDITTFRERNMDFLFGANHAFGKFGIDVTAGGNQMKQIYTNMSTSITNFYVRDLYTIGNGQTKSPNYTYSERRVNSLYGSAEFSFDNYLFLNLTARNDWFSTLNPQSNNYLYPSANVSFILSQALSLPGWINYAKIRGGYAEVGGDTDPYSSNLYYSINSNPLNGVALGGIATNTSPNANLKPLKVKEAEVGFELRLFDSRATLDFAAYKKNTEDEILNVDISNASGYSQTKVNLGKLRNKGYEMLLIVMPVKAKNFTWETGINGSINNSEVISLANNQARLDVGSGEFFGTVSHEVGMPLASLRGIDYQRDDKGNIKTSGGKPLGTAVPVTFGSAIPTYTGAWQNTFTYKELKVFAQIDFKGGNKIMSNSNLNFLRHGLSKPSLVGREGGVLFEGYENGAPNTTKVEAEDFYATYRSTNIATPFIYKGDFIRWRSLTISYDLSKLVKAGFIKGINLSLTGYNLLMIKKYIDNLDPEASLSAQDFLQGIESHTLPTTRSYGFYVNIKL